MSIYLKWNRACTSLNGRQNSSTKHEFIVIDDEKYAWTLDFHLFDQPN